MSSVVVTIRRAVSRYAGIHERGVAASLFGVAILVLLGMVALGVDGSRIYDERRKAQNAADHAAIAAAFASCSGDVVADAIAAGEESAEENGYLDGADVDVTITHEGDADSHEFTAAVDTQIGTTFAQVIGFGDLRTNAFARAQASGCGVEASPAAIHAGGNNCAPGSLRNVEISGNDHTVYGLTRTNGSFYNGGSGADFLNSPNPSVEYVSSFSGGSNTYSAAQLQFGLPPTDERWPDGFDPTTDMTNTMWNAYRDSPNRRNTAGGNNQSSMNITSDGIYYTENSSGVTVTNIANNARFTIASKNGPVRLSNSYTGRTFHAYPSNPPDTPANVLVVSGYAGGGQPCDQFAFERSGEGGTWNGLIWTPRAMSRWSGNLSTINGGFVTWSLQLNGNNHTINGGTGEPEVAPDVLLVD